VTEGGSAAASGDRGLQAERTFLAYGRTQLVGLVAALLVIRDAHTGGRHALAVVVAVSAVLVICLAAGLRQRRLIRRPGAPPDAIPRSIAALTAGVVLLQVTAMLVVL
jgi:uncharacterized membrane protein YidH (DUF202 family)